MYLVKYSVYLFHESCYYINCYLSFIWSSYSARISFRTNHLVLSCSSCPIQSSRSINTCVICLFYWSWLFWICIVWICEFYGALFYIYFVSLYFQIPWYNETFSPSISLLMNGHNGKVVPHVTFGRTELPIENFYSKHLDDCWEAHTSILYLR